MAAKTKVVLYGTPFCPYCVAARKLLDKKGVSYEEIPVSGREMRRELARRSGRTTVPQIFINDEAVGGFDDLCELDADGQLDALLGPA